MTLSSNVLVAEEAYTTTADGNSKITDEDLAIGCFKKISELKVVILATYDRGGLKKLVVVETATVLERLFDQLRLHPVRMYWHGAMKWGLEEETIQE